MRVDKFAFYILCGVAIAAPLAALPLFVNFINATKAAILFAGALALAGMYVWQMVQNRSFRLTWSPLLLPAWAMIIAMVLSSLLTTPYPMEALTGAGGAWMAAMMVVILGGTLLPKQSERTMLSAILTGSGLLALATLLQLAGFGPSRLLNPVFGINLPHDGTFNLAGSPLVAAQVMVIGLAAGITQLLRAKNKPLSGVIIGGTIASAICLVVLIGYMLPGKPGQFITLPFGANWSIAIDTLRTPRTAFIGVGPEQFGVAYQSFKPLWINGQPWWQSVFSQGFNVPLHLLVTNGLVGLGAWLALAAATIYFYRQTAPAHRWLGVVALVLVAMQLFFPINSVTLILWAVVLATWMAAERDQELYVQSFTWSLSEQRPKQKSQNLTMGWALLGVGAAALLLGATYGLGTAFMANNAFYKALLAYGKNDALGVYNHQQTAKQLNPFSESYRREYALVSLSLATALSNKTDLTEAERQQVVNLVQQAVRESRAATQLGPNDSKNWYVLAKIYQQLTSVTKDANQFAVSSYLQAINLEPGNPGLYLDFSGFLYQQGQYQEAAQVAAQAAQLKPDLPNAYYNLAASLSKLKQYDQARQAYQKALSLIPSDSEAAQQIAKELQAMDEEQKKAATAPAAAGKAGANTAATPSPSPVTPSLLQENLTQPEVQTPDQTVSGAVPATSPTPAASPAASPAL